MDRCHHSSCYSNSLHFELMPIIPCLVLVGLNDIVAWSHWITILYYGLNIDPLTKDIQFITVTIDNDIFDNFKRN